MTRHHLQKDVGQISVIFDAISHSIQDSRDFALITWANNLNTMFSTYTGLMVKSGLAIPATQFALDAADALSKKPLWRTNSVVIAENLVTAVSGIHDPLARKTSKYAAFNKLAATSRALLKEPDRSREALDTCEAFVKLAAMVAVPVKQTRQAQRLQEKLDKKREAPHKA